MDGRVSTEVVQVERATGSMTSVETGEYRVPGRIASKWTISRESHFVACKRESTGFAADGTGYASFDTDVIL